MLWKACRSRCRRWPTPWGRSARRSIPSFALWKAMSWRQSACTRMIRPYRFWPKERPTPGDAGYICATTGLWRNRTPAAIFYYSRDRRGEHPQGHLAGYAGILQADAYDGYNKLYQAGRSAGPILEAACWVHARRPFFAMADIEENARRKASGKKEIALSPIAIEIVRRIDALFEIERSINGKSVEERLVVRQMSSWHWSTTFMSICVRSSLGSLAGTTWPKRSITFSSAGWALPYSFRTGASASRTTPPNEA